MAVSVSVLVLIGCSSTTETPATSPAAQTADPEVVPVYGATNGLDLIGMQDAKPEVAPVPEINEPNRIAMNLPEDPATSMSSNWYTTENITDSVVRVFTSEDMSDAVEFSADVAEVASEYAERDAEGYYIYASVTTDEEGDFLVDEAGYLPLQEVTEHTNKVTATGLQPDMHYWCFVSSGGHAGIGVNYHV